ncbi:MAG: metal ABC transporter permease [Deltaproteobacteria bacterium]|nr:MAG: metal ABC transporter permease [Deltaproteobacteria bacterium]
MDFFSALSNPENAFLRQSLLVGLFSSIAFGIIGTYVVSRRISYLAGAVSHSVLGGIGAVLWLKTIFQIEWLDPLYGALPAALVSAFIVGHFGHRSGKQREETMIGATWAIGMALGIIFVDMTPGYFDITSYLFGDILLVSIRDLQLIIALDLIIILFVGRFYHTLMAICFDEEFARLRGLKVDLFYQLLLGLTAVSVVLLIRVVGIVMVIAMLTLPAATAALYTRTLSGMMLLATVFSAVSIVGGIGISYSANLSSGPMIIVCAGVIYFFLAAIRKNE